MSAKGEMVCSEGGFPDLIWKIREDFLEAVTVLS